MWKTQVNLSGAAHPHGNAVDDGWVARNDRVEIYPVHRQFGAPLSISLSGFVTLRVRNLAHGDSHATSGQDAIVAVLKGKLGTFHEGKDEFVPMPARTVTQFGEDGLVLAEQDSCIVEVYTSLEARGNAIRGEESSPQESTPYLSLGNGAVYTVVGADGPRERFDLEKIRARIGRGRFTLAKVQLRHTFGSKSARPVVEVDTFDDLPREVHLSPDTLYVFTHIDDSSPKPGDRLDHTIYKSHDNRLEITLVEFAARNGNEFRGSFVRTVPDGMRHIYSCFQGSATIRIRGYAEESFNLSTLQTIIDAGQTYQVVQEYKTATRLTCVAEKV